MATRDLATNSLKSLNKADAIIDFTTSELIKSYKVALKEVRSKLADLYSTFMTLEEPTKAQLTQFMRNSNIEREIVDIIRPYLTANEALIKDMSVLGVDSGFFNNAWSVDQATGVSQSWGLIDDISVRAAAGIGGDVTDLTGLLTAKEIKKHAKLLEKAFVNYGKDSQKWISQAVKQGIIQGESIPNITKRIQDVLDMSYNSAERIARTEVLRSSGIGNQVAYDQARDNGSQIVETWDATLDNRTRSSHAEADGAIKDNITGMFTVFGGEYPGPRRTGIASEDINCFPGFVNVTANKIEKAYKREYSGKVNTIKTSGKLNVTVTPNHPILTVNGWVKADSIKPMDYIVSMPRTELRNVGKSDINDIPSVFQEVFDFLSIGNPCMREPSVNKQFHGDGSTSINTGIRESDVNVVTIDSELLDTKQAFITEHIHDGVFPFTEILFGLFPLLGSFDEFFDASFISENSIVSILSNIESIIRAHIVHSDIHGVTTTPDVEIELFVKSNNDVSRYTKAFSSSLARFAKMVSFDKVVSVSEKMFNGHVYNLQTNSGWYIVSDNKDKVNGIIAHNCRCISVGELVGLSPELRALQEEGQTPYQSFETWATEQGITVNRFGEKYNFTGV